MRRHLTYANVTATIALFVALGGGAYAVSNIGSGDVKDNSIRSLDLRDRHGVKGIDVHRNGLGGREIDEGSLNTSRIVQVSGDHSLVCNPNSSTQYTECVKTSFRLHQGARILAIATGGEESIGGSARASCQVQFDGGAAALASAPGEAGVDNTDPGATNGFARTEVSPFLPAGRHQVTLACLELTSDVRIDDATIAAIAVNSPK